MWQIIRDLVARGVTILLTTQYLDEADELADRIPALQVVVTETDPVRALDALLRTYPDALVIQTHRPPRAAIASVCSLAAQATGGWSTTFRGEVIGRDQLELWARGLDEFTAARARYDPAQFCDVDYGEFVADPVGTVESAYAYFGLEVPDDLRRDSRLW